MIHRRTSWLSWAACSAVLCFRAAQAEPWLPLPAPTGAHAVGRSSHFWAHPADAGNADDRPRSILVNLWYPAEITSDAPTAPYFEDLKALGLRAGMFRHAATHARVDAPPAAGAERFPLVLLSPGAGMNGFQYTTIAEELVSHGYVVAAVDHPGQSWVIVYPDGRKAHQSPVERPAPSDAQAAESRHRRLVEQRVADLRLALDHLAQLDQDGTSWAARLDFKRVGALGHSIGGVAAVQACEEDPRIQAALNLDGHTRSLPFLLDSAGRGPTGPLLEITDGNPIPADEELARRGVSRQQAEQQAAEEDARVRQLLSTVAEGCYRVTVPGIRHVSFSDMLLWDAEPAELRLRRVQILRDYVRAFFDKTLRGQGSLLDEPAGPYAEVTIERFGGPRP